MARRYGNVVYIDRNPNNPDEGWGWVEVTTEDAKRWGISTKHPLPRMVTKQKEVRVTRYRDSVPYIETHTNTYTEYLDVPSRGRAGAKKFALEINGEQVIIKAQKSLTIPAFCAWVKTWAPHHTKVITLGNRAISLDGDKLAHQAHFVYFILNEDSNAIKIGRAKDLEKRMKALQTSSPAHLKLMRSVRVESAQKAKELEQSLHQKFQDIRLTGEWFKADERLLDYIGQI